MPLGYGVFLLNVHACTHVRTRARNAHARAHAHMHIIYILVVGVVIEYVEKLRKNNLQRRHALF